MSSLSTVYRRALKASFAMLLGMLIQTATFGQGVFPLNEDFESSSSIPSTWQVVTGDGATSTWTISNTGEFNHTTGGNNSAQQNYDYSNLNNWLITPQVAVPSSGSIYMVFWSLNVDAEYYGKNSVYISTGSSNPLSGDFVEVWSPASVGESTWEPASIDLSPYHGQNVYIAFVYAGMFAHSWYIDDVKIDEMELTPEVSLPSSAINIKLPTNLQATKNFTIKNNGLGTLTYTASLSGNIEWATLVTTQGTVNSISSGTITLSYNTTGLEVGSTYNAEMYIETNDNNNSHIVVPINMEIVDVGVVSVATIANDYLFPCSMSHNGQNIIAQGMNDGADYYWNATYGLQVMDGSAVFVNDECTVAGSYTSPETNITTVGTWTRDSGWNVAPPHPDYPGQNNYAYSATIDAKTIVGMQYTNEWSVQAFAWSSEEGYNMIGSSINYNSRFNGTSEDGSVMFGWADTENINRTPIIWFNDEFIYIDSTKSGEAQCVSPDGNYVAGTLEDKIFIWSKENGGSIEIIGMNMPLYALMPLAITNEKVIFGYSADSFMPTSRVAFTYSGTREFTSFNEYATTRGMLDADEWSFISINCITPDQRFISGVGYRNSNPYNIITVLLDFDTKTPYIQTTPNQIAESMAPNTTSKHNISTSNTGSGLLVYNAEVQYVHNVKSDIPKVKIGRKPLAKRELNVKNRFSSTSTSHAPSRGISLHYDSENFGNALGVSSGGTIYSAVYFPSQMLASYVGYAIDSIDVFIFDLPTATTLYIYGEGTTTSPGNVIAQQSISNLSSHSWNRVALAEPILINGSGIWISIQAEHEASQYPLGCDNGPANSPNGCWISMDGTEWSPMTDYNMNFNWNIRANINYSGRQWLHLSNHIGSIPEGQTANVIATIDATDLTLGTYKANVVFRSNDYNNKIDTLKITLVVGVGYNVNFSVKDNHNNVFNDATITFKGVEYAPGVYNFTATSGEHPYKVHKNGYYEVEGSVSVSNADATKEVIIISTSIVNNVNITAFFPNPATSWVKIGANEIINSISIYNTNGQLVLQKSPNEKEFRLEVSNLASGLYTVSIRSSNSVTNKKLVVKR